RLAISTVLYVLGFWAPWLRFGASAEANPAKLWSWLAIELARPGIVPIQIAYETITLGAIVLAVLGAALRFWGTAYLGRSVVFDKAMHAHSVVAAGPYRYVRNPLYLGSMLTALAISISMPVSGAAFFLVALCLFVVRLALGEESFLRAKMGDAYDEFSKHVPRWLPSFSSRLPASEAKPAWSSAAMGEFFPLGIALCFIIFSWRDDSDLLTRCVLICFGVSLVLRALRPKQAL
ncbi:MAG: isoprenylcysteine carboxylmethyltransferase family protein, partial [Deltaproteobacteria bacterium]|nr:isoprenylcysteine carboxylmethyltransferase family protein [Deltaproteobacteria bacterium]